MQVSVFCKQSVAGKKKILKFFFFFFWQSSDIIWKFSLLSLSQILKLLVNSRNSFSSHFFFYFSFQQSVQNDTEFIRISISSGYEHCVTEDIS